MKNMLRSLLAGVVIISLTGCHTTEKFVVKGTPGTTIYSPQKMEIAKVGNDGKAKIELESNRYYAYLLTYDNSRDLWIPFALDTREKKRTGAKAAFYGGATLTTIGSITMLLPGVVMACSNNEDTQKQGAIVVGGSAGAAFLGLGIMGYGMRSAQLLYRYCFTYQGMQFTNQEMNFTSYTPPLAGNVGNKTVVNRKRSKASSKASSESAAASAPQSKAKRSRQSAVKAIEGDYAGSGYLSLNNKRVEDIPKMRVKIIMIDNNTVKVEVYEGDESFFENDEIYTVSKDTKGEVVLVHSKVPSATIKIKGAQLTYTHPKIDLDDGVYSLTIKAARK